MTLSLPLRRCLLVKGDVQLCHQTVEALLAVWQTTEHIWLTHSSQVSAGKYAQKQARQFLGREFDVVVFDALQEFNADSFAAIIGTLRAGGILVMLLPETNPGSNWYQRFELIVERYLMDFAEFHHWLPGQILPMDFRPEKHAASAAFKLTVDQQNALSLLHKTAFGHRRRPLVITSDRGRGKTALLGIAAAELLRQGKQKIVVTAPSYASVDTLFKHAAKELADAQLGHGQLFWNECEIQFVAPDALLENELEADVLLVDEAAALTLPMLTLMLQRYSRIIFATTLHGYEGSGRGFKLQFQQILEQHSPGWRQIELIQPVRWDLGDVLEQFSFELCLLDAEPIAEELIVDLGIDRLQVKKLTAAELLHDEVLLRQCFGLMVMAHYRTRPSDLQMLLDREDMWLLGVFNQQQLVASVWLAVEGPINPRLAAAVFAGERRLNGHLLPQTLLAHSGISIAGEYHYQRIVRIAVHPALQNRGIGKYLLNAVTGHLPENTDILGCSFAASETLLRFWQNSDYRLLRVGAHSDHVSGRHAAILAKPVSEAGQQLVEQTQQRLIQQWPELLHGQLSHLESGLIPILTQMLPESELPLSAIDEEEITAFAFQKRHYDACQIAIRKFVLNCVAQQRFLSMPSLLQSICLRFVLQQQPIAVVCRQLNLKGKQELLGQLREAIRVLLL
ncbi:tRNA(Met) cytidine acetyltransferase TmcA [Methylophaga sp.]|uniref:tRNA(Met) cytidine acetyltransferase TmcA n=1 Tax=Methylophaga sp. TaxID=2024840 RepID=UPI0027188C27|nr:GNAT family N-acetyltransferase [Methylophaga sp.]MDO8826676.1 GNAT family N-acetyltransferase [Methylophaga sp.]